MLAGLIALAGTLLTACSSGLGRSAAAVCQVWATDAVALHQQYENSSTLGAIGDLFGAPNDIATLMDKMATVAPTNIEPDFAAVATAMHQEAAAEGNAAVDLLGALASGLINGLSVNGSMERVDDFLAANCQGLPGIPKR